MLFPIIKHKDGPLNPGDIKVTVGAHAGVLQFFEYFEPVAGDPIVLTVH